jgi:copper chaperone CopZ
MNSHIGALGDGRVIVVTVPGMDCRHDIRTISAALADVEGVVALQVDLDSKCVWIEGNVAPGAVRAAIVASGYSVR